MKKLIRLTEGDLHRIVKESVQKILSEGWNDFNTDGMSPEEINFRRSMSPGMMDQSKLVYHGKLSNGNTFITYEGQNYEVSPKGKIRRCKDNELF